MYMPCFLLYLAGKTMFYRGSTFLITFSKMWFRVEIRNLNRYLIKYRLTVYRLFYSYPVKRCEYILWLKIRKKYYKNNNSNARKSSFTLVDRINKNDSSVNAYVLCSHIFLLFSITEYTATVWRNENETPCILLLISRI